MTYFLYLLECADTSIYTGITTDVTRRLAEHKGKGKSAKLGARYTRGHGAVKIIYSERFATRSAALKREAEVKKWKREKKMELARV